MRTMLVAVTFTMSVLVATAAFSMQVEELKITVGITGFPGVTDDLYLEKGDFQGDTKKAIESIQQACKERRAHYKPKGSCCGVLTAGTESFSHTPYGIDIPMLLKFFKIDI